jgi:hypothetical protein
MPLYTPSSGNSVNFDLISYSAPSGNSVNFTLDELTSSDRITIKVFPAGQNQVVISGLRPNSVIIGP